MQNYPFYEHFIKFITSTEKHKLSKLTMWGYNYQRNNLIDLF